MFGFCQVFYTLGFIWHRFQLWASLAHSSTRTQKSLPLARPVKQKKVGLGLSYTGRGENVYFPASFKSFLEVGVSEIGEKIQGSSKNLLSLVTHGAWMTLVFANTH